MTPQIPAGYSVRYDYHEHPTGVSAVLVGAHGSIKAVGFAKFNHRDPAFSYPLGERIALGRAVARMEERHRPTPAPRYYLGVPAPLERLTEQRTSLKQLGAEDAGRDFMLDN